ncbi:hypothetical protein [Marinicrinis sediminis]|uniref:DUF4352 domain-containing protein n=1 Tax=Marinicrinis sediminis TaxID=1652465 RepID=A0ABW5RA57_9BACL
MKANMCWTMLVLAGFLLLAGCQQQVVHASHIRSDTFSTTIHLPDVHPRAGDRFVVETALVNHSERAYEIHHGAPLIFIEIEADNWSDTEPKVNLVLDIEAVIEPHEEYDPDTENFINGMRTLKLDEPGRYLIRATAHFSVWNPATGRSEGFAIHSEAVRIDVR